MTSAGSIRIDNIGQLVTNDPTLGVGPLGLLTDAAVVVEGGRVVEVGPSASVGAASSSASLGLWPCLRTYMASFSLFIGRMIAK